MRYFNDNCDSNEVRLRILFVCCVVGRRNSKGRQALLQRSLCKRTSKWSGLWTWRLRLLKNGLQRREQRIVTKKATPQTCSTTIVASQRNCLLIYEPCKSQFVSGGRNPALFLLARQTRHHFTSGCQSPIDILIRMCQGGEPSFKL